MYIVCIEYMFCTQEAEMCTDLYAKACIHEVYPWCMVCTIVVAVHLHSKGLSAYKLISCTVEWFY